MPNCRRFLLALVLGAACISPAPAQIGNKPGVDRYGDPLPDGAMARFGTHRMQHAIYCLAYSPDGKMLASSGHDGITYLWNATTGKALRKTEGIWKGLAFSPDNKTLAAHAPGKLTLLDVATGKPKQAFKPPEPDHEFQAFTFTEDGRTLLAATAPPDGAGIQLLRWDVATGVARATVRVPLAQGCVALAAAADASGKAVLFTAKGNVITQWSTDTGMPLREPCWHNEKVQHLTLSPGGETLASADVAGIIAVWETATGKLLQTLSRCLPYESIALSPDGKCLMGRYATRGVSLWDVANASLIFKTDYAHLRCATFSPDGKRLATSDGDGARITEIATATTVLQRRGDRGEFLDYPGHRGEVTAVAFSPDSKTLVSGGSDGAVVLWSPLDGTQSKLLADDLKAVYTVAFAPGRDLLAASGGRGVSLWDRVTGKLVIHHLEETRVGRAAFFPDGKTLLVGDDCTNAWLCSVDTGQVHRYSDNWTSTQLLFTQRPATALSLDGKMLVELDSTGKAFARNPRTGQRLFRIEVDDGLQDQPVVGQFAPDNSTLALVRFHETASLLLIDVATSKVLRANAKLGKHVPTAAVFSPSGSLLALGNHDGSITLLETLSGAICFHGSGHRGAINDLAFSPNGKLLASASADGTILLWDADRFLERVKKNAAAWSDDHLSACWEDLGSTDAKTVFDATFLFRQDLEKSSAFLVKQLNALWKDRALVRQLILKLDASSYKVREKAFSDLAGLGEIAAADIEETLKNKPGLEVRMRLEILARKLTSPEPSPRQSKVLRAMAILECAATPEARAWLEELAAGLPRGILAREARSAVDRMRKRAGS